MTLAEQSEAAAALRPEDRRLLRAELPAWPVTILYFGLPVYWLLGMTPFMLIICGALMAVHLLYHPRLLISSTALIWGAFLFWVMVSASMLSRPMQAVGFLQTFSEFVAMALLTLYVYNASSLTLDGVARALSFGWVVVVTLGLLAVLLPTVVLTTPVGLLLPSALTSNELVKNLVFPPMAEVQQPWGANEPFNRPSAPFPYTNSWGMAYLCFFPSAVLVCWKFIRQRQWWFAGPMLLLFPISAIPVVASSNRALILGLVAAASYVALRLLLRGRLAPALAICGLLVLTALSAIFLGFHEQIAARQEVSDTTTGRMTIYARTLEEVARSPVVGWATPQVDPTLGIALGTQGYVWRILFSYGWVGAGLFFLFLAYAILRSWRCPTMPDLALHAVLIAVVPVIFFYGLGTLVLTTVVLIAALLSRRAVLGWPEPDRGVPWT